MTTRCHINLPYRKIPGFTGETRNFFLYKTKQTSISLNEKENNINNKNNNKQTLKEQVAIFSGNKCNKV